MRTTADIEYFVKQIVIEILGSNPEEVTDDAQLDSLGGDSLDITEVVLEIEQEFLLPDGALDEFVGNYDTTVGALVRAVQQAQSGRS